MTGLAFGAVILWVQMTAQSSVRTARRGAAGAESEPSYLVPLIVLVLIVGPVFMVVRWIVTTYTVGDRELTIDSGVLTRTRRVVPYLRIQQVDVHQKFLEQVIGAATLTIDTASESGQAKVRLGLLSLVDARSLRAFALRRREELSQATTARADGTIGAPGATSATGAHPGSVPAPEREIDRIGPGRLLLSAATNHMLVLIALVVLVGGLWAAAFATFGDDPGRSAALLGTSVVLAVVAAVGIGVFGAIGVVLSQYGFTVSEAGDDLHLRFGLFEVRNLTVPRRRIQHVAIEDNPVRRLLGQVSLTLHTAAPADAAGAQTSFTVPILARRDLEPMVRRLLGRPDWSLPELTPRPPAAQRRAIVRRIAAIVVALSVPAIFLPGGFFLLVVALVGVPWGQWAHARAGHGLGDGAFVVSRGVLHHRIDVVLTERVQSARRESNPLQRRVGLATCHTDVAGSSRAVWFYDMEATSCDELVLALPRLSTPPS